MVDAVNSSNALSLDAAIRAEFLDLLPRIERCANLYFRDIRCPQQRADQVAECVALGWKWLVRLHERGKDVTQFPAVFVSLLARAVKCGRRITGQESAKDVLSSLAQKRHGFRVEPFPVSTATAYENLCAVVGGQRRHDAFEERLIDNTVTPVPDQAVFRIDFPAWLSTLTSRERRLIRVMAMNERTSDLATRFALSSARISQLRREFQAGWKRFCD